MGHENKGLSQAEGTLSPLSLRSLPGALSSQIAVLPKGSPWSPHTEPYTVQLLCFYYFTF